MGLVSEEEKVRAFVSTDLYIAPNTGGESFGIVLLEAMASGTPVVASDIEAFARVLEDGEAGALFRNEDSADLADVINELLDDPVHRGQLSASGRERALEFDWQSVAARIVDVYESVTVTGERVTEDLRGQVIGRLSRRPTDRDEAEL
jgi:phosphatidylinositol alpha-mannosyltransferase